MKKISSKGTFYYKRMFPAIWFGFLGIFIVISFIGGAFDKGPKLPLLIIPLIMAVFGYFFMKKLVFDLVDEVFDEGSGCLLVKNNNTEQRIDYQNIKNISYTVMTNPNRVTLSLRYPCKFGNEVSFSSQMSWVPFRKNKDIIELINKVNKIRGC
jgi:hypothetical protein